mgnify:FL=1
MSIRKPFNPLTLEGKRMQTTTSIDKRTDAPRNPTLACVTCRPFTSSGATHTADGVIRNYSGKGVYMETSHRFKSGTILHLRIVEYPTEPLGAEGDVRPRSICLAEVKWRQELADANGLQYGLGLRYLD